MEDENDNVNVVFCFVETFLSRARQHTHRQFNESKKKINKNDIQTALLSRENELLYFLMTTV